MFKHITNEEAVEIDKVVFAIADVTFNTLRKFSLPGYIYKGRFYQRYFLTNSKGVVETNPDINKLRLASSGADNSMLSNIQIPIKGNFYIINAMYINPSMYYVKDLVNSIKYDTFIIMHNSSRYAPYSIRGGEFYDQNGKVPLTNQLPNPQHTYVFVNEETYINACKRKGSTILPYGDLFYTSRSGVVFCTSQPNTTTPACINMEAMSGETFSHTVHIPYEGCVDDKTVSLDTEAFFQKYNKLSDYNKKDYLRPISLVKVHNKGVMHNQSCADFIKSKNYTDFSYYINLIKAAEAGNTEEDVKKWFEFLSDIMEADVTIEGIKDNVEVTSNESNVRFGLYEIRLRNCYNEYSLSNYVRVILLRYLMSTTKGYFPKLIMEIYDALKDKPGMTKWKAIGIAHFTIPNNADDTLGRNPNLHLLKSITELAKLASDYGMTNGFSRDARGVGINQSLFENKKYEEIYSQLKKYYVNL